MTLVTDTGRWVAEPRDRVAAAVRGPAADVRRRGDRSGETPAASIPDVGDVWLAAGVKT